MLFRSHKDLLEEFTYFLPDAQAPAQVWTPRLTLIPLQVLSKHCSLLHGQGPGRSL
jgi:hypothetical protein